MKVNRLVVGKGKTSRPSADFEEWTREYYEVEVLIEDASELETAKANLTGLLDSWLTQGRAPAPVKPLPQLDPDELEKLPWKTYRTKEPAKPGEAAWTMRDTKGAEALVDLLEKQGKEVRVQIGTQNYVVKFSGDKRQFLGRAPIKEARQ